MAKDDDIDTDPCPGCGRDIESYHSVCPHCQYDIDKGQPAQKKEPKPPKVPKPPKTPKETKTEPTQPPQTTATPAPAPQRRAVGKDVIYVPALGRMGRPDVDFPELHWTKGKEPTDENLRAWGEAVRDEYPNHDTGQLSNHAIGYLAYMATGPNDAVLVKNKDKIVELLGGDEWH